MEKSPWTKHWGKSYDPIPKSIFLSPLLGKLADGDMIGNVVVDVGSGKHSVTQMLPGDRKIITLDLVGVELQTSNRKHIRLDIEKAADSSKLSAKKALVKAARFLGLDPREEVDKQRVDLIIFSEILNYVDYQKILSAFSAYLKPDGRILIVNGPIRGFKELFSEKGLKSNNDLCRFLESSGFEIEQKRLPWMDTNLNDDQEMMVLVARKATHLSPTTI